MPFTVTQSGYGGDVTGRKRDIPNGRPAARPALICERQAASSR
jgi:hypothetical protein